MLSDRRKLVLKALIEEYISCASPIGSRRLVERYNLGISSATVRSELSLLEEMGLLAQPHTSAGRVPTDYGYRAFVDDLLAKEDFLDADDAALNEARDAAGDLDDLMDKTSQALARLTDCLTVLLPPRCLTVEIRMVNLVRLSERRLLVVVVADDGQVYDRQIEPPFSCSEEDVERTQELLTSALVGRSISVSPEQDPPSFSTGSDPLLRLVIEEIHFCLRERNNIRAHPLGMSHLLDKPEFADSSYLSPVLEELEGDTLLMRVFDDAMASDEPLVRIGHENDSAALDRVSLVANRFGSGDSGGIIVIVGPTRMNYSRVIKAVRAARNILKDL